MPAAIPVTVPVSDPIVITPGVVLQVPPGVASYTVVAEPVHTVNVPVIARGMGLTVIGRVVEHPPERYVTMDTPAA